MSPATAIRTRKKPPPRSSLGLLLGVLMLSGCWLAQTPTALPDLSAQRAQVEAHHQRIVRIHEIMARDLADFESRQSTLFEAAPAFWAKPFPLDLFKHVAMTCLNQPWNPDDRPDPANADLREHAALTCTPAFLEQLDEALLNQTPDRRVEAIGHLLDIDALRRLRGQLRDRNARLSQILLNERTYLADQRNLLRRQRASLSRRRTEYSLTRWRQVQSRMDRQGKRIDDLEAAVARLDQARAGWPQRIDEGVLLIYTRLSNLSLPAPPQTT